MKTKLIVINIDKHNKDMTLKAITSCNSCGAVNTCGNGILSKYLGNKTIKEKFIAGIKIGDKLELEINNKVFLTNAALLYLSPIFALFIGVYIFSYNDILAIISALCFFIISIFLLYYVKK